MEYIDKISQAGVDLVEDFLNRSKANGVPYPNDLYDAFDKKSELREILVDEQDERCCYCMRRIDKSHKTTLEHLIINKIESQQDYDLYPRNNTVLDGNVCYAPSFIASQVTNYPPYPHTVAYHNFTASCNGNIENNNVVCCNLKRGNIFIEPLVLYSDIKKRVSYKRNGYVVLDGDIEPSMMETLGLNYNVLRIIRAILIYAKESAIDIFNCSREELVYGAVSRVSDNEDKLVFNFKKDVYWNLLKDYDYFLHNPNIQP